MAARHGALTCVKAKAGRSIALETRQQQKASGRYGNDGYARRLMTALGLGCAKTILRVVRTQN